MPLHRSMRTATLLAPLLPLLAGCADLPITPATIRAIDAQRVPQPEQESVIAKWREAVAIANDFLASSWRRSLPAGHFTLDDSDGMAFVTERGAWPIAVRCTTWGDLCVAAGFVAQEREWGFVVGETGAERDELVDNTLFLRPDRWGKPAQEVAELILHETAHVVWREGTIGTWNSLAYYLEALFLFRTTDHSAEERPNAVSHEFRWYWQARAQPEFATFAPWRQAIDDHLAREEDDCDHGPYEDEPDRDSGQ